MMELKTVKLIDGVFELCREFIESSQYVTINADKIKSVGATIKKAFDERSAVSWMGYPKWFEPEVRGKGEIDYMLLAYELMAGAVNYQYWYGKYDVRPNGAGATMMYELLDESFELAGSMHTVNHRTVCKDAAQKFIRLMSLHRLPNVENRIKHVKEIAVTMDDGINIIASIVGNIYNKTISLIDFLEIIVSTYPGYAGDMFLKRPFLLAMMLYRRVKWFEDDIYMLPIPADYQIPKMLRWLGCIEYNNELLGDIANDILIPSGSNIECEIRAASILACQLLAEEAGVSMCDVDTYLWLNRKGCADPFHLTVTTDY